MIVCVCSTVDGGSVSVIVVPASVYVVVTGGTTEVMTCVIVSPGRVTVVGGIVMVCKTVLPGSVSVKVVPGKVVIEPGRVVVITSPGAVETLVEVSVNVVRLPEILVVVV